MKKISKRLASIALSVVLLAGLMTTASAASLTLTEQYIFGGAISEWYAEESYYAEPVVVDLDDDGTLEAIHASYTLSVLDAATGTLKWRVNAGVDRSTPYATNQNPAGKIFCDFVVEDVDDDGLLEIVIAYEDGTISVLNNKGYFKAGWPQRPTEASIHALTVADVNLDGQCEIIVGAGVLESASVWMYSANGQLMPGWPQLDPSQDATVAGRIPSAGYSYGVFANGIATGNLDDDPALEILVPTDTAYIEAYNLDGTLVPASSVFGVRPWGRVALYEDYKQEQLCENEGWGFPIKGGEGRANLYRAELGHSAATVSDLNNDGKEEIVVTALMTDRTSHSQSNLVSVSDTRYMTIAILNADRTRFVDADRGYNWEKIPVDLGAPLRKNDPISVATGLKSEPVCVDLDGDGQQEILFSTYNGQLQCFNLKGKRFGNWPFRLPQSNETVYEYATTPTTADLNGDGKQEVIFASWTQNEKDQNTGVDGALYITDYNGNLITSQPLPKGYATYEGVVKNSNNVLAAPVVSDIDNDGKEEILLNTTYRALCAYKVVNEAGGSGGTTTIPTSPTVPMLPSSNAPLRLDGNYLSIQSYVLDGSNYVKLRDVALLLNGTKAQFEVTWSAQNGIGIAKGKAYTAVGGELQSKGEGNKPYTAGKANLSIDGTAQSLAVCTVEDNNYFKLRDLAQIINVQVGWDNETKTVILNSALPYAD